LINNLTNSQRIVPSSRYVVGIDLGTTNSAAAFADTGIGEEGEIPLAHVPVPQLVQPATVEERPLLPSFLYLPGPNELPAGSLRLPWAPDRDFAVGEFARKQGGQVPTRLVSSAKSWLCVAGVDRRGPILPWGSPENARRISPLEASTLYLRHLREAWDSLMAGDVAEKHLESQDIVLTVPASFDAVARELTVEAARAAGLEHVILLEEPQAAFYSWIEAKGDQWRHEVEVGDVVLVCDIGGGTTDFTLIAVGEESGQLTLTRVAVGDHILLGGDNMDLSLAHTIARRFQQRGTKLDAGQMLMLWHACRRAKETLFADPELSATPVTVLGRGSRVIGNVLKDELTRTELETVLVNGFFPECTADTEPKAQRATGLQELGLPYAADPAVTKHLAQFLKRNAELLIERLPSRRGKKKSALPTAVLFNGGVFKGAPLRERLLNILNQWSKSAGAPPPKVLKGTDLDLAVARGAAYYGMVRRGRGIRIRGGTARSYYVGVEASLPAVPGGAPPIKALCVVPFGMEEGTEADLPDRQFGLVVGVPAEFRFLGSSVRHGDSVGVIVEDWESEVEELSPLTMTLEAPGMEGQTVPVHLHSKVTEVGTLELWCLAAGGKKRWKLEFNVRQPAAPDS
jgi:molecular chaperone DnaK (HSP70)